MNKSKLILTIVGFVFAATWAASAQAAPPFVECSRSFDPTPAGSVQNEVDADRIDKNDNNFICCKDSGSGNLVCVDDK